MAKTPTPPPAQGATHESLKEKAIAEMKVYLAISLYLWVLLALFAMFKKALLQENGLDYWNQSYAFVSALILGKVILLGDILKLGDSLRNRAMVWVVLGKTLIFTVLLMGFHVAEELIRAAIKGLPLMESILHIGGGSWFGVYTYAAIMFVMLIPLAAFLSHAALEAGDNQAQAGQDAIQLMTVHSSKGLEFDCVFITGMEEGLFPHENSMNDRDGLEEERRLMYVAVTRARQRLYLSHAQSRMLHGQVRYGIPSRFLDEIPDELLKHLNSKPVAKSGSSRDYSELPAMMSKQQSSNQKNAMPWKIGQQVAHNKFGNGVVVSYEGNANDMRVQVNFGREGLKWLALEFAKLTPL